jgi:hypothetical protein
VGLAAAPGTARRLVRGGLQPQPGPTVLQITPATTCGLSFRRTARRPRQSSTASKITQFGPDVPLPDLRDEIAKCERSEQMHDACGVHYASLRLRSNLGT